MRAKDGKSDTFHNEWQDYRTRSRWLDEEAR